MDMKLGGWGQLLTPKFLKVTSSSSGIIQGQMRSNGVNISVWTWNGCFLESARPMETPIGGWKHIEPCSMHVCFWWKICKFK